MYTVYNYDVMEELSIEDFTELKEQCELIYSARENIYINIDTSSFGYYYSEIVSDDYIQDNDLKYCEDIEEYRDYYDCVYLEDSDDYVTEDYAIDNCYKCYDCGNWYRDSYEGEYINDEWYCDNCAEDHKHIIYSYHDYDGAYIPRKLSNEAGLYLGFELEVDETDDNEAIAESVLDEDTSNVLHCEYDSSVEFEFISQPCTLMYHRHQNYEGMLFDNLRGHCTSHDAGTCGLHIHVNKDFFDDRSYTRLKTILFFFKQELFKFSRRQDWDYEYADFDENIAKKDITISKAKSTKKYGHGTWFNENSGSTYEFRFFRGTLKYSTFMASLELVDNICKMAVSDEKIIRWNDLLDGDYCREYNESRNISCDIPLDFEELENREIEHVRSILDYINKYVFLRNEYVLIGSIDEFDSLRFDFLSSKDDNHLCFYTDFDINDINDIEAFLNERGFIKLCNRKQFESLLNKGGVL